MERQEQNKCPAGEAALFCPKCKAQYRMGYEKCSDCHADLVHELPKEDAKDEVAFDDFDDSFHGGPVFGNFVKLLDIRDDGELWCKWVLSFVPQGLFFAPCENRSAKLWPQLAAFKAAFSLI